MIDPNGLRPEPFTHSSGVAADNMSPEDHAAWDRIDQLSRKGFEDQEGIFAIIDLSLGGSANGVMNPADVNIYYGAEAAIFLQGYAFRKALGTLFGNGNGQGKSGYERCGRIWKIRSNIQL